MFENKNVNMTETKKPRRHSSYQLPDDLVSAADIVRAEAFLTSGDGATARAMFIEKVAREAVVSKYNLVKNKKYGKFIGKSDEVFAQLQQEYPSASKYRSFLDMKYAMLYHDPRNGEVRITRVAVG